MDAYLILKAILYNPTYIFKYGIVLLKKMGNGVTWS